jgi:release factor glutamine methyltransferase
MAKLGLEIELVHGDWFAPVRGERFDVVVSNPPYVASQDPHLKRGDVRFEPRSALVAGADGLDEIREIVRNAAPFVKPSGWVLLEHGEGQEKAVQALFSAAGYIDVTTWPDLAGIARATGGKLKSD